MAYALVAVNISTRFAEVTAANVAAKSPVNPIMIQILAKMLFTIYRIMIVKAGIIEEIITMGTLLTPSKNESE